MSTVWILEDDPGCLFVYETILGERFTLRTFKSIAGLRAALAEPAAELPRALIADVKLPDGSFTDFRKSPDCSALEKVPLLIVSSVIDANAEVGPRTGLLDYLSKPFEKGKLIDKLNVVLAGAPH